MCKRCDSPGAMFLNHPRWHEDRITDGLPHGGYPTVLDWLVARGYVKDWSGSYPRNTTLASSVPDGCNLGKLCPNGKKCKAESHHFVKVYDYRR